MTDRWERLATRTGGTVSQLALAKMAEGVSLVFAATAVGVYRSSDGGRSWQLAGTVNNVPLGEAIAPAPSFARDRTLFVGAPDGLHRSSDDGQSWQRILVGSPILSLATSGVERESLLLADG